jgi:hypothetical protein
MRTWQEPTCERRPESWGGIAPARVSEAQVDEPATECESCDVGDDGSGCESGAGWPASVCLPAVAAAAAPQSLSPPATPSSSAGRTLHQTPAGPVSLPAHMQGAAGAPTAAKHPEPHAILHLGSSQLSISSVLATRAGRQAGRQAQLL